MNGKSVNQMNVDELREMAKVYLTREDNVGKQMMARITEALHVQEKHEVKKTGIEILRNAANHLGRNGEIDTETGSADWLAIVLLDTTADALLAAGSKEDYDQTHTR